MREQTQKITYIVIIKESITFAKKIITKNDLEDEKQLLNLTCNVVYKPKDILGGDSYIIRKIK